MDASPHGVVLAAGEGARLGMPKALVVDPDGTPWLRRVTGTLRASGCARVSVVLGAGAGGARVLAPGWAEPVVVEHWRDGLATSLRAGLAALAPGEAAVITHVDVPDLPATAVIRMLHALAPDTLRQATYDGRPGHPVVVGPEHVAAFAASLSGDAGGRAWLVEHGVEDVPCDDLFDGTDIDEPDALTARLRRLGAR